MDPLTAELQQLREALVSRTTTAQATGLLAARFGVPTDRAWRLLRELSNMCNEKLVDIARVVVLTHDGGVPSDHGDLRIALALGSVLDAAVARVIKRQPV